MPNENSAPVSATTFVEWMKSQPKDRRLADAFAEFMAAAPHTAAPAADRAVSELSAAIDRFQSACVDEGAATMRQARDELEAAIRAHAAPPADRAELVQRLNDEADQCRNDGADDIAGLLDEAARALARSTDAPSEPEQVVRYRAIDRAADRLRKNLTLTYEEETALRTLIDYARGCATPPAATTSTQGKLAESASEWKSRAITEACAKWSGAQKIEAGDFIEWLVRFPILATTSTEPANSALPDAIWAVLHAVRELGDQRIMASHDRAEQEGVTASHKALLDALDSLILAASTSTETPVSTPGASGEGRLSERTLGVLTRAKMALACCGSAASARSLAEIDALLNQDPEGTQ